MVQINSTCREFIEWLINFLMYLFIAFYFIPITIVKKVKYNHVKLLNIAHRKATLYITYKLTVNVIRWLNLTEIVGKTNHR